MSALDAVLFPLFSSLNANANTFQMLGQWGQKTGKDVKCTTNTSLGHSADPLVLCKLSDPSLVGWTLPLDGETPYQHSDKHWNKPSNVHHSYFSNSWSLTNLLNWSVDRNGRYPLPLLGYGLSFRSILFQIFKYSQPTSPFLKDLLNIVRRGII